MTARKHAIEPRLRLIDNIHGIDKNGINIIYRGVEFDYGKGTTPIIIKAEDILRAHVLLRKQDK